MVVKKTVSHITLYTFLVIYVAVAILGAVLIVLFMPKYPEIIVQLFIAYFSFIGISATVSISFYFSKSQKENERKIANAKNDFRLDMAKEIFELIRTNKLDSQSISLLKILISDSDTSVNVGGCGDTSVIDNTTYSAPNIIGG